MKTRKSSRLNKTIKETMDDLKKPYISVVSCKDTEDGDCNLTLDVNQAGRELLIQAGVQKTLEDYIALHSEKLSLWKKLQICWGILK